MQEERERKGTEGGRERGRGDTVLITTLWCLSIAGLHVKTLHSKSTDAPPAPVPVPAPAQSDSSAERPQSADAREEAQIQSHDKPLQSLRRVAMYMTSPFAMSTGSQSLCLCL